MSAEQIKAFRIADNKTGDIATYNKSMLREEVRSLKDFDITRFGIDFKSKKLDYGAERLKTDRAYNLDTINRYCCGRDGFPPLPYVDVEWPRELQGFLLRGGGYVSKDRNEDDFELNSRKEVAAYIAAQYDARKILDHKSDSFRDEIFEVEYAKVPVPKDKSKSLVVGVKLPPSQSKALRKDYKAIEDERRRSGKAQRAYDRLMREAGIDNPTKAMSRKITLGANGSSGKSEPRYPELNRKYKEAMA